MIDTLLLFRAMYVRDGLSSGQRLGDFDTLFLCDPRANAEAFKAWVIEFGRANGASHVQVYRVMPKMLTADDVRIAGDEDHAWSAAVPA